MIGELGYNDLRQQAGAGRALLNRLRRLVRRFHRAVAAVLQPHILDHLQRGRNVFVAFAGLFRDQMQIFAAAVAVLFRFRQIVHDPFPHQMPCQRLSPASLLRWRFGRILITLRLGSSCFFDDFFRLAGLPEFLKQGQLIFRQLFAFAIALRIQQFAYQAPVLVFFRALVFELLAQIEDDLLQHIDVFRQSVGIDGRRHLLAA